MHNQIYTVLNKALPHLPEELQKDALQAIASYQFQDNLDLTAFELRIYTRLAETPGISVSYADLLEATGIERRSTLQVHKLRLMRKLKPFGKTVATKLGIGYSLEDYHAN